MASRRNSASTQLGRIQTRCFIVSGKVSWRLFGCKRRHCSSPHTSDRLHCYAQLWCLSMLPLPGKKSKMFTCMLSLSNLIASLCSFYVFFIYIVNQMSLNVNDYFNDRISMCDAIHGNAANWVNTTGVIADQPQVILYTPHAQLYAAHQWYGESNTK